MFENKRERVELDTSGMSTRMALAEREPTARPTMAVSTFL